MQLSKWGIAMAAGVCSVAGAAVAGTPAKTTKHPQLWTQGEYLVTRAAPCADCHTPRDHKGQLIVSRTLQGAPIDVTPIHPVPGWVSRAPSIAGLPQGWTFDQTARFLETGVMPDGGHAGPPMPAFRFNAYDARAIATYLQSLPKVKVPAKAKR